MGTAPGPNRRAGCGARMSGTVPHTLKRRAALFGCIVRDLKTIRPRLRSLPCG